MSVLASRTVGEAGMPEVVFLHGFMGEGADWLPVAEGLAARFHSILIDLPGHGSSRGGDGEEISMDSAVGSVMETLDALRLERCGLVGYSMGGRLALFLALAHPDRFTHLVLESASPGISSSSERRERQEADEARALRLESLPHDEFLAEWYGQPLFASLHDHPDSLREMLRRRARNDPAAMARVLRGMGAGCQDSLWERLASLRTCTLVAVGALDAKYVALAERMAAESRVIHAAVIPAAGHAVHMERPDELVSLLGNFLSRPC